jgi:tRNA (mo5U34)-methyltransferase
VFFLPAAERERFHGILSSVYPNGLEGRSFLDCACNCGGYSFWAKELGAGDCFGFDVREHWIKQANFLLEQRQEKNVSFRQLDLYDLDTEPFDVTLFKGILYHLPDPVTGLKIAAERTKELLIVNTAIHNGRDDGALVLVEEPTEVVMSGVHGLAWLPTGPEVLKGMLRWMGFKDFRVTYWEKAVPPQPPWMGRLEILASRNGF